jgi:hypothetical protein
MPQAHNALAKALVLSKRFEEALRHASKAIELECNNAAHHTTLGYVYLQANRLAEAEPALVRATELDPNAADAWGHLGYARSRQNRPGDAAPAYERAAAIRPDIAEFADQACASYLLSRKLDKALETIDRAVPQRPQLRFQRSIVLLSLGRYEEGFADYEWRVRSASPDARPREYDAPVWDGSDPTGRTILVHSEQGYGDAIQFARYLPMLAARGASVIAEVLPDLRELIASVSPDIKVISTGMALPKFDLHVPLMSLPRIFKTTLATIPAGIPYLHPNPARIEKWKSRVERVAREKRIGLVWGGKKLPDPRRSILLKLLAPLAAVPNVTWFSLQTGEPRSELSGAPASFKPIDIGKDLADFSDTAAVMSQLDLLITIDTAAAHLAGALGVNIWTLLPYAPDWRWTMEGEGTPWYPAMRLFRQSGIDRWEGVVEQVRAALLLPG